MQRLHAVARARHVVHAVQRRHGSGGAPYWYSARWSRILRSEANIDNVQDPPVSELPESHEAGDGVSDFSNWVNKHEDISTGQAVGGVFGITVILTSVVYLSQAMLRRSEPTFALRELPSVQRDIPTAYNKSD